MANHRAPRKQPDLTSGVAFHNWYPVIAVLATIYIAVIALYHAHQVEIPNWRIPVIIVSFAWLVLNITAAHFNRPVNGPVPDLKVGVFIPSRNEDPEMLRKMLASLDAQSYPIYAVYFIENGVTNGEAEAIFREWAATTAIPHPEFIYRQDASKRGAQVAAFARAFQEKVKLDVIATVDGDTELDSSAIIEGLKPFANPRVTNVAGLLLARNYGRNLLTRIVNLGFVASFMNGRAAWSSLNSVAVSCGGLAFYSAWVIEKYLAEYRDQQLFGKEVSSGDDRMLTGYAALEGYTVFQHTSVGYTLVPANISHLTRQRGRWWRSFWWGSIWLLRRFNPNRAIWWLVLSQLVTFVLYAVMFPLILVVDPILHHSIPWAFFAYTAALSYLRLARTLMVSRPDQSLPSQLLHFVLLAPLVTVVNLWLCTMLQYWGLVTFHVTGWRTRDKVEVGLQPKGS